MGFSGTSPSVHQLQELLAPFMKKIGLSLRERGDHIVTAWPEIIGKELASMTEALTFENQMLVVKVKNSTLFSLLNGPDKPLILKKVRERFPQVSIRAIIYRLG